MSMLRDFPEAYTQQFMPPGTPTIQLVNDPVCAGHPFLSQFTSSIIPGVPCGRSAVRQAHWINTGRLLVEPVPDPTPVAYLVELFGKFLPEFPVYLFVDNPLAPLNSTMVCLLGPERQDGWKLLFIPAMGGVAPHVSLIRCENYLPHPPLNVYLILYSDLPIISPYVYWHPTRSSPLFYARRALGMACMCKGRCSHRPLAFFNALRVCFAKEQVPDLNPMDQGFQRFDAEIVVDIVQPPYSMGKLHGVRYTFVDGKYTEVLGICGLDFAENHIATPYTAENISFRLVYFPERGLIGIMLTYLLILVMITVTWTCVCLISGMSPVLALFIGIINFFITWQFGKVSRKRRPFQSEDPRPYVENWLPPSLRSMPFANDLANKLATHNRSRAVTLAALRRAVMATRNEHLLVPSEVDLWLETVCREPAEVRCPAIPLGHCSLCFQKKKLRHCLCVDCSRRPKPLPMSIDCVMVVGMLPIWTCDPLIPLDVGFRPHVIAHYKGCTIKSTTDAMSIYQTWTPPPAVHGRLAGPMYLGYVVNCFPRGIETTIVAFAIRLGIPPANTPDPALWTHFDYIAHVIFADWDAVYNEEDHDYEQLDFWTPQDVLDHQRDARKRLKLALAYAEIDQGLMIPHERFSTFGAFPKLEKHVCTEFDPTYGVHVPKTKLAPRLINSPHPHVNAVMSQFTLPLIKWLKRTCNEDSNMFYAGCSKPPEINKFYNRASRYHRHMLEDDVSMMDGSQHEFSQRFQHRLIRRLFAFIGFLRIIDPTLYRICMVRIRQSGFRAFVQWINASGVPLTSFLNSVTTMIVRMYALVYAYTGIDDVRNVMFRHHLLRLIRLVFMAVAGDDGLLFLPAEYHGTVTFSPEFMERYIQGWQRAGFDVGPSKIRTFTPANWRLATFLAMRPVWSGAQYELGVEINRRLKTMFWILDKSIHPFSWGRGVATALLASSRHVPVIADICHWYLARTVGAVATIHKPLDDIGFTNPYSTVYGYSVVGHMNNRGVREFLDDYHLTEDDYASFLRYLWNLDNVLVNLDHPVLRTIAIFG